MERLLGLLARVPPGPVVSAIAVAGIVLMSGTPNAAHRVPDLEGIQVNPAIAKAAREGYFTRVRFVRGGGRAGTVIDQAPQAWDVRSKGSKITLVVTKGEAQVEVPDVRGVDVDEARRRLDRGNVLPGDVVYRSDESTRSNHVITTVPPPGKLVDVGTTVVIIAAAG